MSLSYLIIQIVDGLTNGVALYLLATSPSLLFENNLTGTIWFWKVLHPELFHWDAEHSTLLDQVPLRLVLVVLIELLQARLHIHWALLDRDPAVFVRCHYLICDQFGNYVLPTGPFLMT